MAIHIFKTIDCLFLPNNATDKYRLNPISFKKLKKGDAIWSTTKTGGGASV